LLFEKPNFGELEENEDAVGVVILEKGTPE